MDLAKYRLEWLREDPELALYRAHGAGETLLALIPASLSPDRDVVARLENELALDAHLESAWAIRPRRLVRHGGRDALLLEDPSGGPLERLLGEPIDLGRFLDLALRLSHALVGLHSRGLVHKDVKPANVFVTDDGRVLLTGFGFSTRVARERASAAPPPLIAGTLAYMAPEQTGRMNRSVDRRSDLYALGVTFYEMLAGRLPFESDDPRELLHSHVARPPPPLHELVAGVPPALAALVGRLLAKNADERYQTAAGVARDLGRCRDALAIGGAMEPFGLGANDVPDSVQLPEGLYGRGREQATLQDAFESVATRRRFQLVLVSGDAGIGKSSFVNELQRTAFARGALFAAGKHDPFRRDIPYATLTRALRALLRQLLGADEPALARWRAILGDAVGGSGQLLTGVLPELALIIGSQPPPAPLSGQDELIRFRTVFRRFLAALAGGDHPLVLFLDDLQWLDAATLDLLEHVVRDDVIPCLLLIGACRSDELAAALRLRAAYLAGPGPRAPPCELQLGPLAEGDVRSYVADALRCAPAEAAPLATVAFEKTRGNAYLVGRYLLALESEQILAYEAETGRWRFDPARARETSAHVDVAGSMADRLARLDAATVIAVQAFAALGHTVRTDVIGALVGVSAERIDAMFLPLVHDGLLSRRPRGYAFAHDTVREAAYEMIEPATRAAWHLAIARLLRAWPKEIAALPDRLFETVNHVNRAAHLVTERLERQRWAAMNLAAAERAKATAAPETAAEYLAHGLAFVASDGTPEAAHLRFELQLQRADSRFMLGEIEEADQDFAALARSASDTRELVAATAKRVVLHTFLGRLDRAIELSIHSLAQLHAPLPAQPSDAMVGEEYQRLVEALAGRPLDVLGTLPVMSDPAARELMVVLCGLLGPAGTLDPNLQAFVALRMARATLEYGCIDESAHALACLSGLVLGWRVGSYLDARRLSEVVLTLVRERGLNRYARRVYSVLSGTIGPWSMPLRDCFELAVLATASSEEPGGLHYSGFAWATGLVALLASGEPLAAVERYAERGLEFSRRARFVLQVECVNASMYLIRALRGSAEPMQNADGIARSAESFDSYLAGSPSLWHAKARFRIRQIQASYYLGATARALELARQLEPELAPIKVFEIVEFRWFAALAAASQADLLASGERAAAIARLREAVALFEEWAGRAAENFGDRHALLEAELARVEGRDLDAQYGYERAITAARAQTLVHNEALSFELAARYYASRGFETTARAYLREAHARYVRWGADRKAAQLVLAYPELWQDGSPVAARLQQDQRIDVNAVVEMSQAVSGEIVFERLIERLMVTVVETAGAVRGALLLPRDGQLRLVADAATSDAGVTVTLRGDAETRGELPQSIINVVARSRQPVILDDAADAHPYSSDPYLLAARTRSVLCLALVKQDVLVGVLYLDNDLVSHVFSQERLAVLQLLAAQAAISIENAELFASVRAAQEHARAVGDELRRSFDMIPALAWRASSDGTVEFANKQWHDYTGISPDAARRRKWFQCFHPDDQDRLRSRWRHCVRTGSGADIEGRLQSFDGETRRFLVRTAPVRNEAGEIVNWHGTSTDIESLRRHEQAQEALARATRITALGELTVSIAHEISQPLTAIAGNANACLRWLSNEPPDAERARLAAQRIIQDGHRASQVIAGIRSLAKKAPPQTEDVDLHEVVFEVLAMTRNQMSVHGIVADTTLSTEQPLVSGARVQLQQVLLNLVINAIEAMSSGPSRPRRLHISSGRADAGFLAVAVADTGPGLTSADVERLFESFYTTKTDGLGIGLSICRSIVEAHGGRLWAGANRPQGSVFTFTVPVAGGPVTERAATALVQSVG